MSSPACMPVEELLARFSNGDETSWEDEFSWIRVNHPRRLDRIKGEISDGFFPPVRLCFTERRVIDGHHRIAAAVALGRTEIPVADAWDTSSDWWRYASSSGSDDEETP